jgi:hypothetical protein
MVFNGFLRARGKRVLSSDPTYVDSICFTHLLTARPGAPTSQLCRWFMTCHISVIQAHPTARLRAMEPLAAYTKTRCARPTRSSMSDHAHL